MSGNDDFPQPFRQALEYLTAKRGEGVRIDAISGNFAYVWIPDLAKNTTEEKKGGWIRLPLAFPYANPHGLITSEALKRSTGENVPDGYNPGHEMCAPVSALGGAHYYSWTWDAAPQLRHLEDIVGVAQWYERRIRNG